MIRAFVSSTYRDLQGHRAYVIDRLTRCGIFVDPMEQWTAASDEPKTLSQERVRDCQLCILLVGFRRGHIPDGEKLSITQMEFLEAKRRKIDVLVFMANEDADWPAAAVAALHDDPEAGEWREQLKEHKVVGFFTPRPESINIEAAVARWLQDRAPSQPKSEPTTIGTDAIELRAYSNSDGVLLVWRIAQPIAGCLGFAVYRRVLGTAGITDEIVGSIQLATLSGSAGRAASVPTTEQPIQNFRWFFRERREVRYRVVPVTGIPGNLKVEDLSGSNWTSWVSARTGHTAGCRAFFTAFRAGAPLPPSGSEMRAYAGGELRGSLLDVLRAANLLDQRVYVVVDDLDDPDLVGNLAALGKKLRIVLSGSHAKAYRALKTARAHVHERQTRKSGPKPCSSFVVLCDRWGTPISVWTASTARLGGESWLQSNNGVLIESVAVARAWLDRWHDLRDICGSAKIAPIQKVNAPTHLREDGMALTLWSTPMRGQADLRDVARLIRGARQGVLFLLSSANVATALTDDIDALQKDKDLLIEGILWSRHGTKRVTHDVELLQERQRTLVASRPGPGINSTIVLIDPFGPHPVVITGSHNLSSTTSAKGDCDLVVIENAPGLAAEYAVHVIGLIDRYRFQAVALASTGSARSRSLATTDAWQQRFFQGARRTHFNFLFGALSPGV